MSITLKKVRTQVAGFSLAMMIASMFAVSVAQAATFVDVQPSDWFYPYVEDLAAQGILNTSFTNYRPADLVNRAEMAKLVVEAFDLALETPTEAPFKDVALGQWYTSYVYTAQKNSVVNGYKDNTGVLTGYFGPGDPLTREQAMKMCVLAAPLTTNTKGGPHFPDVPLSVWSYEFVETGYNWSVVDGYPDGSFKPGNNINRAEIAKMVSNCMSPVMRPGAGFNVDDASAMSATTVEVCYSGDVGAGADDPANYMITDVDGAELAVTAAALSSDPMCVDLTTAAQTAGKNYDLLVSGVMSAAGEELDIPDVSFVGFMAGGTGGDLTCTSGEQPAGISVPKGATGIPFTVVNCSTNGDPVVLSSMTFHRFGAGDEQDLADVYLYEGDYRLTTGRSVNSETQTVEFSGLNLEVDGTVSLWVVADIELLAEAASQHGFELLNADAISSNAGSVDGDFPIEGNLMTISGATAGTVTMSVNGSLDELTIGETGRVAQFELEASGAEAMEFERVALYVRGTCDSSDVTDLKLYVEGGSEVLASTDAVGNKDLATLVLDNPYVIGQGDSKIFYVEAKVTCRNNETVDTWLDETTDLHVTGTTFGTGVLVDNALYDGGVGEFSTVTVKGSDFTVAFNGPDAGDIAIGQDSVSCLDLTITNASGEDVEISDWSVELDVINGDGGADDNGLVEDDDGTANYTLLKLARVNEDGSIGGSLLGPSELVTTVGYDDNTQDVVLDGDNTIAAGESIDAAIVFDVANNAGMDGDQIRCTLDDLATAGADYVRDLNGDELGAESITPSTDITGNIFTVSDSGLTFEIASTPSSRTYVSGTNNAQLVGLSVRSGSSLANTIKSLTLQGYVDCDEDDTEDFADDGTADDAGECFASAVEVDSVLKDIVDSLALYDGLTKVSDLENVNAADGEIVFNNLNIFVPKSTTVNLTLQGHVNSSAPYGVENDRIKFGIEADTDVVAIDSNGQNVAAASIDVADADNGLALDTATDVVMTISPGGTGTVSDSTSLTASVVTGASKLELARFKLTSDDDSPVLKDMQFGILNDTASPISKIYLASLTGGNCGATVGSASGYTSGAAGIFNVTDLGVTITDGTSLTLCVLGDVNQVGTTDPDSGDNVGVALLNITEITGGSGTNVSDRYVSDQAAGNTLDVALTAVAVALDTSADDFAVGDVLVIDQEMMLVVVDAGDSTYTVIRGFGNTTAAAHLVDRPVGLSTLAVASGLEIFADVGAADVCIDLDAAATGTLQIGDVVAFDNTGDTITQYALVTGLDSGCADATDIDVVRGLFGQAGLANTDGAGSDEITRLPVHGDLSRLRKSKPAVSLNTLATSNLPGSANTRILSFRLTATGQEDVTFTAADGIIEVTLTGVAAAISGDCTLRGQKVGSMVTDTYDIEAPYAIALIAFDFANKELTMSPGEAYDMYVDCDTTGYTASSDNLSASLVSAETTIQWNDGDVVGIDTDGVLLIPSTLTGPSFTNPS